MRGDAGHKPERGRERHPVLAALDALIDAQELILTELRASGPALTISSESGASATRSRFERRRFAMRISAASRKRGIQKRITAALHRQAQIDARRVSVELHDGRVTLQGSVSSWHEAVAARTATEAAPGVSHVESLLTIAP